MNVRKYFLNSQAITGLFFGGLLTFLIVHDMIAQDVTGGGSSSTSVVTGTDEKCKDPGTSTSATTCIVHCLLYTSPSPRD